MLLADKVRILRETEGQLRGLGRALTQGELVKAIHEETGKALSQSYVSQIESGARPHLTNTTRLLLARFFKVHPGFLVDDPEGYQAELMSDLRAEATLDAKFDAWLVGGAERFRRDPELHNALITLAMDPESRASVLLLERILETPGLAGQLAKLLRPELPHSLERESFPSKKSSPAPELHAIEEHFAEVLPAAAGASARPKVEKVSRRAAPADSRGVPHAR